MPQHVPCPTCTSSASTGSTSHRCCTHRPGASTGTTSSTRRASTLLAVERKAWPHSRQRHAGSARARRLGMGVIVDVVPNHMGVADPFQNLWWADVLAKGQASPYAGAFDIDWAAGGGRLLLPVVGDDDLLPHGRIANLRVGDGELRYHDQRFPLAEGT